ncbi:putative autotransporter [Yersinia pseudotuberculosis]|nr:putative autotransporter [Yersinia pseudotuberculosis]
MNTNSKKTYLSIAISSILYASTAMNANADSCTDYTVTDICEQSKYGAGEFHNIKLGDGVTAGSEDHHFVFNGEGYELYNSNANFSAQIASGTIRYTEVNNSHFTVNAHHFPDDTIYAGRAENTTLNDSLMWVATSADQTLAKGNSMVVVSTQMAMVDQILLRR